MRDRLQDLWSSRWIALAACCWIQALNATVYLFSAYSHAVKISLRVDQRALTTIATFTGIGSALGILPGYLYNLVPPWLLILAGIGAQSLACLMIWLTISHRIIGAAVWQLCAYEMLIGISQAFIQTPVVVTSARNFSRDTGTVIGLLKGYQVLGGSIILQVFYVIYGSDDQAALPFMISWMIPFMLPLMLLVRSLPRTARMDAHGGVYGMSGSLAALAAWLLVVSVSEVFLRFSLAMRAIVVVMIALLLLLLLVIAVAMRPEESSASGEALIEREEAKAAGTETWTGDGSELTAMEVFTSLNFWLLFVALAFGFGAAVGVSTNLAQLAISLGHSQRMTTILVSLFCVCSCWSRVGVGLLADYCLKRFGTPRSVFLTLGMISNAIGTACASIPVAGGVMLATVLGAISEGVNWGLTAAIACDAFGSRSLSVVFNALFIANPTGYYLLSSRIVGYLYDIEAGDSLVCRGGHCFRGGFAVLSAASCVGACICWFVSTRTIKRTTMKNNQFGHVILS